MSPAAHPARQAFAGSALACLAVLASGCASGGPAATPTRTVTVTASPAAPANTVRVHRSRDGQPHARQRRRLPHQVTQRHGRVR